MIIMPAPNRLSLVLAVREGGLTTSDRTGYLIYPQGKEDEKELRDFLTPYLEGDDDDGKP